MTAGDGLTPYVRRAGGVTGMVTPPALLVRRTARVRRGSPARRPVAARTYLFFAGAFLAAAFFSLTGSLPGLTAMLV